jgi:3-oxoacyl-[acyl-carrier protein] reductase
VTIAGELRGEGPMNREGVDVYPSLNDKVVVVTGAGNGIGRAIAERFAGEGSKVVVNDLAAEAAEAVVAAIRDSGGTAMSGVADVSRSDQVNAMIATVVDAHGGIDVLVNNAGIVSPMLHFFDADEAWWRRIIDVNLTGHFLVSHPIARIMAKAGGGAIINMSSGGATKAHRAFTAYDATKGGIEALTRAMALDLGPYNIRVNALMPGSIDTSGLSVEERILRGENVPLGRIGEPHDMTGAALFLASDDASYITGDVIKIDGGMTAQQRSATVDIMPPSNFPKLEDL